jgi:hypothetical protein
MRRALLQMMAGVVVLHTVAVLLYRLAHLGTASPLVRGVFTVAWASATFLLVSVFLKRIRTARRAGRR